MQEPSYPSKSTLVSTWFLNGIDSGNNSGVQRVSHLEVPTKYQYLNSITNSIPTGGFFDTIVDVDCRYHAFHLYIVPTLV
jgi:hypothetical protein